MKRLMVVLAVINWGWLGAAEAATHTVVAADHTFTPASLSIIQGDTVVWTNASTRFDHTTTSGTPPSGNGLWNAAISPGQTYSRVFSTSGEFAYFCIPHYAMGMTGIIHVAGSPWAGAANAGGGWSWLSWFGFFNRVNEPWIYHEQHGWMYGVGTTADSIWLYSASLGWTWTSQGLYPFLYSTQLAAWLYYLQPTSNPRWFNNMSTGQWVSYY